MIYLRNAISLMNLTKILFYVSSSKRKGGNRLYWWFFFLVYKWTVNGLEKEDFCTSDYCEICQNET